MPMIGHIAMNVEWHKWYQTLEEVQDAMWIEAQLGLSGFIGIQRWVDGNSLT